MRGKYVIQQVPVIVGDAARDFGVENEVEFIRLQTALQVREPSLEGGGAREPSSPPSTWSGTPSGTAVTERMVPALKEAALPWVQPVLARVESPAPGQRSER